MNSFWDLFMPGTTFWQLTFQGLALGAAYALIALGFVIIYRSSEIFNFAHGEFLTIGAFSMTSMVGIGLPWPMALLAAMMITGAVSAGVERAVVRPMIGRPVFVTIILTIFIGFLLRAAAIVIWGPKNRHQETPWKPLDAVTVSGVHMGYGDLILIGVTIVAMAAFFCLLKYTKLGVAMRATSNDQEVSLALGIPVGRIFGASWFLAGMYAAIAGVFLSMFPNEVDGNIAFTALKAFPAIIVGGLTSPVGTVIAGVLLGLTEMYSQAYLAPELGSFGHNIHDVFPYVVMILFLMVRPYGLFGHKEVERV